MVSARRSLSAVDDPAEVLDHPWGDSSGSVSFCSSAQLVLLVFFIRHLNRLDHLFLREELPEVFLVSTSCGLPQGLRVFIARMEGCPSVKCIGDVVIKVLHTGIPVIRSHCSLTVAHCIVWVASLKRSKCRAVRPSRVEACHRGLLWNLLAAVCVRPVEVGGRGVVPREEVLLGSRPALLRETLLLLFQQLAQRDLLVLPRLQDLMPPLEVAVRLLGRWECRRLLRLLPRSQESAGVSVLTGRPAFGPSVKRPWLAIQPALEGFHRLLLRRVVH